MAHYAVVGSVLLLLDTIIQYPELLLPSQGIVESLHHKFSFLLESLQDYSSRSEDVAARGIRDVTYRVQNILESEISNQINRGGRWNPMFDEELVKVGEQVDSATEKSCWLSRIACQMKICSVPIIHSSTSTTASDEQFSLGRVPPVGFDLQVIYIRDRLNGYPSELQVISIVGMAGIGKTTLARQIFHDQSIDSKFECRAWVTVSQNYNANKVVHDLLNSLGVHDDGEMVRSRECLFKVLFHRRYLVVVDDISSREAWDDLMQIFLDNDRGSRIVCTTQFEDVVHNFGRNSFVHKIPFLDKEDSWRLLQRMVFLKQRCPRQLEDVGRLVASKCGGLPLAIVVIAQILSNNAAAPHYWEHIAGNLSSILGAKHGILFDTLCRSYDQLTDQLKACFLYLGSFPNDHEISVSKLVKLWTIEGIVKSVYEDKISEQVAKECLENLVKRNLVITKKHARHRCFKFCTLHDVVRKFCKQRACDENFFHTTQDQKGRLYLGEIDTIKLDMWKVLRVLDVFETTPWSVLNAVEHMFHIRYLSLHVEGPKLGLGLPPLPPSKSMLQNLQTLIIHHPSPYHVTFPPQIWKMMQLIHVIITVMTFPLPVSMVSDTPVQKLEYLQTLLTVKDFILKNEAIEMIPNIRKLKVSCTGIEGSGRYVFYHLDNLAHLRRLEELKIMVDTIPVFGLDSIWSSPVFPSCLKKLSIGGCKLPWEEMSMIGSLPNLQILKLRRDSFVGVEWESIIGEFCHLKFLLLEMLDFKYWRANAQHFPCLEHLKINLCIELEEIPDEIGYIPTLCLIEVYGGSRRLKHSARGIQVELYDLGIERLQVLINNSCS